MQVMLSGLLVALVRSGNSEERATHALHACGPCGCTFLRCSNRCRGNPVQLSASALGAVLRRCCLVQRQDRPPCLNVQGRWLQWTAGVTVVSGRIPDLDDHKTRRETQGLRERRRVGEREREIDRYRVAGNLDLTCVTQPKP